MSSEEDKKRKEQEKRDKHQQELRRQLARQNARILGKGRHRKPKDK